MIRASIVLPLVIAAGFAVGVCPAAEPDTREITVTAESGVAGWSPDDGTFVFRNTSVGYFYRVEIRASDREGECGKGTMFVVGPATVDAVKASRLLSPRAVVDGRCIDLNGSCTPLGGPCIRGYYRTTHYSADGVTWIAMPPVEVMAISEAAPDGP